MLSTGTDALDARIGGIPRGHHAVVSGPSGTGKSVLALHYIAAGLERGEPCLLVTGSDAETLDSRGMFIGFSPGAISRDPHLTVLDIRTAVSDEGVPLGSSGPAEILRQVVEGGGFTRIVIDDLDAFGAAAISPTEAVAALARLLAETTDAGTMLVAPGEDYGVRFEALVASASAVLELERGDGDQRLLRLAALRQTAHSSEALPFILRSGGGICEVMARAPRTGRHEYAAKVVILREEGEVPADVLAGLGGTFEIEVFSNLDASLIELLKGHYGVLVLYVDPYDPDRAFDLTFMLRNAGNDAPILFISPSRGLRSATRSRGLRIGGDDFLLAELPSAEIVERITITARRGHHGTGDGGDHARYLQPTDEVGELRPMTPAEFGGALGGLLGEAPRPFFALAILRPGAAVPRDELWEAVRPQVRLTDGDLLTLLDDGAVGLVLTQVDADLARKVIARVRRAHPALEDGANIELHTHPLGADAILAWSRRMEAWESPDADGGPGLERLLED
jgi:KaiC/GvpD/RAD55 family RecA-like ATPase